jgi:hypothetical protein
MTPREIEEYRALRATIRERGTTRFWAFILGMMGWAALVLVSAIVDPLPILAFVPLLVLAALFEVVLALHMGVERLGRYLQVFYEGAGDRGWEHRIMQFGLRFPGQGADPLFCTHFWLAALLNLVPAALAGAVLAEWLALGLLHAAFAARIVMARRTAARQRAEDLQRFEQLKQLA